MVDTVAGNAWAKGWEVRHYPVPLLAIRVLRPAWRTFGIKEQLTARENVVSMAGSCTRSNATAYSQPELCCRKSAGKDFRGTVADRAVLFNRSAVCPASSQIAPATEATSVCRTEASKDLRGTHSVGAARSTFNGSLQEANGVDAHAAETNGRAHSTRMTNSLSSNSLPV